MGVLPSQDLRALLKQGMFPAIEERWVNPASIDLPVTDEIYRMRYDVKPGEHEDALSLVHRWGERVHAKDHRYLLEVDVPYLVHVGRCVLPQDVYAYANPKSTTGRLNIYVRIIADRIPKYDTLEPAGWQGEVWMYVQPRSFPVYVRPGVSLTQLRFINGSAFASDGFLVAAHAESGLFFGPDGTKRRYPHGLIRPHADKLHLTLRADKGQVGWVCDGGRQPLDLAAVPGSVDIQSYFRPLFAHQGSIEVLPGRFYILSTDEHVVVPPGFAAELRRVDGRVGPFNVHDAGFIDPGWGTGHGAPITLEVEAQENVPLLLRHGETIVRIRYEKMTAVPDMLYGAGNGSHYGEQRAAQLAKYFKKAA